MKEESWEYREWTASTRFPAEKFMLEDIFCNIAIYTKGTEYVIRCGHTGEFSIVAGPFDTFEAACAAYEMIKNG